MRLTRLKIHNCCILLAEEMFGIIKPDNPLSLELSDSHFVTAPYRRQAFCITRDARKWLTSLSIKDCRLNGNPFNYHDLLSFMGGSYHARPLDGGNQSMIDKMGRSFWREDGLKVTEIDTILRAMPRNLSMIEED
jgi:hypothetical protein